MGNRTHQFETGGYYHIYNRGVEKRSIFLDDTDYDRFLKRLAFYQQIDPPTKFSRSGFSLEDRVHPLHFDIIAYALMPNHFHLLIKVLEDANISASLAAFLNSYTKYFNIRYERVGSLFQGVFRSVDVTNDEQLLHLVRYILLNPFVAKLEENPGIYPWTSYATIFNKTNESLCNPAAFTAQFSSLEAIKNFITDYANFARELHHVKHLDFE